MQRQDECLFNGLGAGRVMISPESWPAPAEAALTAAQPQVGQRGTTELAEEQLHPRSPREVQSTQRMYGSGVLDAKQGRFNASAPAPTPDSQPPAPHPPPSYHSALVSHQAAASLQTSNQERFSHSVRWTRQPRWLLASKSKFKLFWQASSCSHKTNLFKRQMRHFCNVTEALRSKALRHGRVG